MADFLGNARSIKGANDFLALSKRLKAAGEKDLRNELNKVMRDAAKPLIPKVKAAGGDRFPQSGGLAARMAKKPYRAQVRTGAKTAGVRIVGTKVDPRMDATGRIYHPVFGRKPGVVQPAPEVKGYFSDTLAESGPEVRDMLVKALAGFTERIVKGL